jgi:hypothetical protein
MSNTDVLRTLQDRDSDYVDAILAYPFDSRVVQCPPSLVSFFEASKWRGVGGPTCTRYVGTHEIFRLYAAHADTINAYFEVPYHARPTIEYWASEKRWNDRKANWTKVYADAIMIISKATTDEEVLRAYENVMIYVWLYRDGCVFPEQTRRTEEIMAAKIETFREPSGEPVCDAERSELVRRKRDVEEFNTSRREAAVVVEVEESAT